MKYELISSRSNPKIKEAASYKDGKGEYFLVEGFHLVEMALESSSILTIFSEKPYKCDAKQYLVSHEVIEKLSSVVSSEGIIALCRKKEAKEVSSDRVMILDGVQDPGNVGTIVRGALAFGFSDLIVSADTASIYGSKAIASSQGALFKTNIIKSPSLPESIKELQRRGYLVIGTSLRNAVPLQEAKIAKSKKIAIVVGNEGKGVREDTLKATDMNVRIEMGGIDSLNVAMASSILMYEYRLGSVSLM